MLDLIQPLLEHLSNVILNHKLTLYRSGNCIIHDGSCIACFSNSSIRVWFKVYDGDRKDVRTDLSLSDPELVSKLEKHLLNVGGAS